MRVLVHPSPQLEAPGPFIEQLKDPARGVATDLERESDVLAITFAGIRGEVGIPSYEFLAMTEVSNVKRVFLRDHERSWYHLGVRGLAASVEELIGTLRQLAERCGARRVVCIGNSAGGYAALLYGALIPADAVLAFSPRSFFDWPGRLRHGDLRYLRDAVRLALRGLPDRRYRDLLRVGSAARSDVHYSTASRLDALHALRLAALPGVVLHPHPEGGHQLVRILRDRGELAPVVAEALTPSGAGAVTSGSGRRTG